MLSFFRSIRRSLISEGKTAKYLKYAVGEFLLIVAGILMALQIQNWNENRKLDQTRVKLIGVLKEDFRTNLEGLEQSIPEVESQLDAMREFMETATRDDVLVSLEDIDKFLTVIGQRISYRPLLGNYKSSVSNGAFNLIGRPQLRESFMEFEERYNGFQHVANLSVDHYWSNGMYRLMKRVGSVSSLLVDHSRIPNPQGYYVSPEEFQNLMRDEEIYSIFESSYALKNNRLIFLMKLKILNKQILAALEELD